MKSLTLKSSWLYFAIPSILFGIGTRWGVSLLARAGVPLILSFTLLVLILFLGLGAAALIGASRDRPVESSIARRLWLGPVRVADIAMGLAVGAAGAWAYTALQPTVNWVLGILPFGPPNWADDFVGEGTFLNVPMAHHPWLWGVFLIVYLSNVIGEELWWRGYILPRQAAGMGRHAWIANAFLWCAFHLFQPWDVIPLIPIALALAYLAQRRQSTWVGILAHAVLNSLAWLPLVPMVSL